jgi:hypothetical protein
LEQFNDRVFRQAAQSISLLAWAFHSANESLLEFIVNKRGKGIYGQTRSDSLTEDERRWEALLDEYDFRMMDDFDLVLLDGMRNGLFDSNRLTVAAGELDARFKAEVGHASLESAWRLFHDSLDDNEDDVVAAIAETFTKHVQLVTPLNLNGTVMLLKDLGYDALEFIAHYMAERSKEGKDFFDLSNSPFGDSIVDPDVRRAFDEKLATFKDEQNPHDVLIRIAKEHAWGPSDVDLLSRMTATDFRKLFKDTKGMDLRRVIDGCLQFGRLGNADESMKAIAERAKEALTSIGEESALNRRRVKKYGISAEKK